MADKFYANGTLADFKGTTQPCFKCGAKVVPWHCGDCDVEHGEPGMKAPLVDLACQKCHRHGSVTHTTFASGPPSHWGTDSDANGAWANVERAYEEG